MKRKRIAAWCAAVLVALSALAVLYVLWPKHDQPKEEIAFSGERDIIRATLAYDAGTRTLRGTQEMTITNASEEAAEDIVLRLQMNMQDSNAVSVTNVQLDGQKAAYALDDEDPTVLRIAHGFAPGEQLSLTFTLMIRHPKTDGVPVVTLPQLAMLEDGAWRTDAYDELTDSSYAQAFDFAVSVDDQIAAQMSGARDASFALFADTKVREKEIAGVRVRALSKDAGTAKSLLSQAQTALESLSEAGFAYPFDTLTIADGDTARADGAVYSGLIAMDASADKETLIRRLTRLIARQTFGILLENDPWNAPWLSETLASCAELMAYRRRKGAAAYEERFYGEIELATRLTRPAGVTVGAGTAHFGSDSEMTQVLRDQGAAMLMGIEQAVGEETFIRALRLYIERGAGTIAVKEDLAAALKEATGSSWDGYLEDGLSF